MQSAMAPEFVTNLNNNDEVGWKDMPVIWEKASISGLDEQDQKEYHYLAQDGEFGS